MQEIASGSLDPAGSEIRFDDISIRSPGFAGEVIVSRPTPGESRSQALDSDALGRALDAQDVDTDYVIEIGAVEEHPTDDGISSRSMAAGHHGIEIKLPAAGEGWGQVLLVTDENGIASWQFPVTEDGAVDTTRGGSTVTFIIPGYIAESTDSDNTRGMLGWLGKKVVRALSFALDPVIGKVGDYFAAKWEEKHRPYSIRRITRDTYCTNGAGELTPDDWQALGKGRSLLFIHGTFSRAASAFCELTPEFIDELNERYHGRVFAFDHKTMSEDPIANVTWFVNQMPAGQTLDLDIVCHSRGGLVSRVLAEAQAKLPLDGKSVTVNQIVFVASPNRGTVLTDAKYMGDFIDAYTNILSLLPDNAATDILETIIAVVKQLASGTLTGLDGLQSMNPSGKYLRGVVNNSVTGEVLYRSIAADFEPGHPKFKPWAKNKLMDQIFKEQNDLVVPTRGVYEHNGHTRFPIAADNRLGLTGAEDVHHGNYFAHSKVVDQLRIWLSA